MDESARDSSPRRRWTRLVGGLALACLCVPALFLPASPAGAYEFRMLATTPTVGLAPGDVVVFDVYLDTEGESGINAFSVGIAFDDTVLAYSPSLSEANSYYPLYAPGPGRLGSSWLYPFRDPPRDTPDFVGLANGQVRVEFLVAPGFITDPETGGSARNKTTATATNVWMATLAFDAISEGISPVNIGLVGMFDSFFSVDGVDIKDQVGAVGSTIVVVPEPSTIVLMSVGLVGLGWAGRHPRHRRGA